MERKISLGDLRAAVDEAYELFKSEKEGTPDHRVADEDAKNFAIAVVTAGGDIITKGDTEVASPLGAIVKVPLHVALLQQNTVDELLKKSGFIKGRIRRPDIPVSGHGLRAVSAIEPVGDREGKMGVISDLIADMSDADPAFNDDLYKELTSETDKARAVDVLADQEFYLYDDAALTVDIYNRLLAVELDTKQLATLGATIAADGRNPVNGKVIFDGSLSQSVVTLMALHGPHRRTIPYMMQVGLPSKSSFGGAILAVLPGFGAIAAYSPALDVTGTSVKGRKAVEHIANKLQLNVFASARVTVEK